ncbi:MAG: C40 family peptidase [Lachnospiraceae bacterium]|nr:C40 family peptidase [Lachnospiraceae bacterium]
MTKNTGCNIISVKNGWAKIESGKVKGYVKEEYLLQGEEAEKKALKVATLKAIVDTETLNVRYLPSIDSPIYDQISEDEYYTVEKEHLTKEFMQTYMAKHCSKKTVNSVEKESMYADLENWAMLSIDNEKVFISKDFVDLQYKLNRAVTIQEEQKKSSSSSSNRAAGIVSYAMQFLGNPYVWGGTSLTNGTDCSGFTMGIYSHFGYYLPRTSAAQAAATRTVSSSEVQVGDLFFYGSGSVSHVALYIGGGQIIHASNARDGIKISSAYYRQPLKIGRVM